MDDEYDEVAIPVPPVRFSPWVWLLAAASGIRESAEVVVGAVSMHMAFDEQRSQVSNQMGRELNRLIWTDEEDE